VIKFLISIVLVLSPNAVFCNPKIVSMDTSLSEYPSCSNRFFVDGAWEYTLPDLHGNALKLLNALIKAGVVKMPKYRYKQFLDCYFKDPLHVKKKTLSILKNAISSIKVAKKVGKIRFIGDELCDRGSNDYYTLLVIKKLSQIGVNCEFVISNHGFEFIQGYENGTYTPIKLSTRYANSIASLSHLFSKKLIAPGQINSIVNKCYKPKLKVLSYTPSKDQITIYTHAPAGLQQIKDLCVDFNVQYKDDTVKDLSKTIDKINNVFRENYIKNNLVHTIQEKLNAIAWNRQYEGLERPENHKDYKINFVHGHDSGEQSSRNIYNLEFDNRLGKSIEHGSGKIRFLRARPN
jgi:hypothetical protein